MDAAKAIEGNRSGKPHSLRLIGLVDHGDGRALLVDHLYPPVVAVGHVEIAVSTHRQAVDERELTRPDTRLPETAQEAPPHRIDLYLMVGDIGHEDLVTTHCNPGRRGELRPFAVFRIGEIAQQ